MKRDLSHRNRSASKKIYRSLPEGKIRLLRLQCGTHGPLKCFLEPVNLSKAIDKKFDALSYEWGSEHRTSTIWLHCHAFVVTQTLNKALRALRRPDIERYLWVDALCINQSDYVEKEIHIKKMTLVYREAVAVIAWLAPANCIVSAVVRFLKDLKKCNNYEDRYDALFEFADNGGEEVLRVIMNCRYWSRGWIVQEIASAKELRVQFGKDSFVYELMDWALKEILNMIFISGSRDEQSAFALSPQAFPARILRRGDLDEDTICPDYYLDSLLNKRCSVPQDQVFAFFDLFPEQLRKHITVSYAIKPGEILLQAISGIIEYTNKLKVLGIRSRQNMPSGKKHAWQRKMPSWCPYVGTSFTDDSIASLQDFSGIDITTEKSRFDKSTQSLHTFGLTIGTVSEMMTPPAKWRRGQKDVNLDERTVLTWEQHRNKCNKLGLLLPKCPDACMQSPSSAVTVGNPAYDAIALTMTSCFWKHTRARRICKVGMVESELCLVGLVHEAAEVGDKICWINGCPTAIILRDLRELNKRNEAFTVIGEAYVEHIDKWKFTKNPERFVLK
jgi:hypothetical protein